MQRARHRTSGGPDAVFLWLASVVTLCAGCSMTFGVLERAIDAQREKTARVTGTALVDARRIAARPLLERQKRLIDERVRDLALDADKPTTVARFIRVTAEAAAERHVQLERIEQRGSSAGSWAPDGVPPRSVSFEAIPLDVTLSGNYRSLLATIRALAAAPLAMEIRIAALDADAAPAGSGVPARLTARLHVALQRLAAAPPPIVSNHPFAEDETRHARPL